MGYGNLFKYLKLNVSNLNRVSRNAFLPAASLPDNHNPELQEHSTSRLIFKYRQAERDPGRADLSDPRGSAESIALRTASRKAFTSIGFVM